MPRKPLAVPCHAILGAVLCLAILGEVLGAAAGPAGDPLALALAAPAGPGRMDGGPCGLTLPPAWFADGQTAMTVAAWCRYEAPPPTAATSAYMSLFAHASLSVGPARATLEGGPPLEGFVDLAAVPLSAGGTWGLADAVPQDAETQSRVDGPTFAAICVNLDTDGPAPLLVGGSEITVAGATNLVRNLAVDVPGDPSVSLAALPGARVRLGLAVNPWVEFREAANLDAADSYGNKYICSVTNSWALLCVRVAAAASGAVAEARWIDDEGETRAASGATPGWRPCRDARLLVVLVTMVGVANSDSTPRRCEAWGFKRWDGWLPDADLWRVWELDLAELRRRGLDAPLPLGH